jgi:hypothetical protein
MRVTNMPKLSLKLLAGKALTGLALIPATIAQAGLLSISRSFNRTRRHSHIGGVSPEAFETAAA